MLSKAFLLLSVLLLLSGCRASAFAPAPTPTSAPAQNDTDCSNKFKCVKGRPHSADSTPDGHSFGSLPGPSPVRQSQYVDYNSLRRDRPVSSVDPRGAPYSGRHY